MDYEKEKRGRDWFIYYISILVQQVSCIKVSFSGQREEKREAQKEKPRSAEKGPDLKKTISEKTSSIADGLNKIEAKVADVIREQNKNKYYYYIIGLLNIY